MYSVVWVTVGLLSLWHDLKYISYQYHIICVVELALLVAMRVAQLSNDFQIIYALATALTKIRRASSLERSRAHWHV